MGRGNSKKHTSKLSTAYHEAGHAVAQAHFRLTIKRVSIVPDDHSLGHMKGRKATTRSIEYEDSGKNQLRVERDVIVLLAGTAAQREFMPRSARRHHGHSDYKKAVYLLGYLASPEALGTYLRLLEIRARHLMKLPHIRIQVEALAKALLTYETMDGKQVRAIIQDALAAS